MINLPWGTYNSFINSIIFCKNLMHISDIYDIYSSSTESIIKHRQNKPNSTLNKCTINYRRQIENLTKNDIKFIPFEYISCFYMKNATTETKMHFAKLHIYYICAIYY